MGSPRCPGCNTACFPARKDYLEICRQFKRRHAWPSPPGLRGMCWLHGCVLMAGSTFSPPSAGLPPPCGTAPAPHPPAPTGARRSTPSPRGCLNSAPESVCRDLSRLSASRQASLASWLEGGRPCRSGRLHRAPFRSASVVARMSTRLALAAASTGWGAGAHRTGLAASRLARAASRSTSRGRRRLRRRPTSARSGARVPGSDLSGIPRPAALGGRGALRRAARPSAASRRSRRRAATGSSSQSCVAGWGASRWSGAAAWLSAVLRSPSRCLRRNSSSASETAPSSSAPVTPRSSPAFWDRAQPRALTARCRTAPGPSRLPPASTRRHAISSPAWPGSASGCPSAA